MHNNLTFSPLIFQNKTVKERDRIERLSDKEDTTPSKNSRVNRSSKPNASRDVFPKMGDCDDKGNQQKKKHKKTLAHFSMAC